MIQGLFVIQLKQNCRYLSKKEERDAHPLISTGRYLWIRVNIEKRKEECQIEKNPLKMVARRT
jgi:hypothetical protein